MRRLIEKVREQRESLQEVVAHPEEPREAGPSASPPWGAFEGEKQLSAPANEDSVLDRSPIRRLLAAAHEIASIAEVEELTAAVAELARGVCQGTAAALLRVRANEAAQIVSSSGAPFEAEPDQLTAEARAALEREMPSSEGGRGFSGAGPRRRLALLPLADGPQGLVLAMERKAPGECLNEHEIEHLAVYASLAGMALARARPGTALSETVAREAATLRAIRDGVIALDRSGTVRVLNQGAATALGMRRDEIVGPGRRAVPGPAPLACALAGSRDLIPEPISLPRGRVAIRPQAHEGGIVATVRDLA